MTLRQLTYLGNPVLRAYATPWAEFDTEELHDLARDMEATMQAHRGVGLAAPQVGISKRLIAFWVPDARAEQEGDTEAVPLHFLVNPEITPLSPETELGLEGCLSLPGVRGLVPRYIHIGYRGFDVTGNLIEREAYGFHARVVQHEVDHLNGVMYLDRMNDFTSLTHECEIRRRLQREAEEATDATRKIDHEVTETETGDAEI
ncbi:MAG: peptide deformylase [Alphaproteobacteria bacterium]